MTRNSIRVFFLSLLTIGSLSALPAFAGPAGFVLSSANRTISAGTSFGVPIKVYPNGSSIDTARVVLNFNPQIIQAIDFKFASALNTEAPASYIDNHQGIISWGGFDMTERIESPVTFGTATFKAVGEGLGNIALALDSKLISGGEDVSDVGSYNEVRVTVVPAIVSDNIKKTAVAAELPPEYDYRFATNSTICQPIPSLCQTFLGEWLVSIILLIIVIFILVLLFRRKSS